MRKSLLSIGAALFLTGGARSAPFFTGGIIYNPEAIHAPPLELPARAVTGLSSGTVPTSPWPADGGPVILPENLQNLPQLTGVPPPLTTILPGQRLVLNTVPRDPDIRLLWVGPKGPFCRQASCTVAAGYWQPGQHEVRLLAWHDGGAVLYRFAVKIRLHFAEKRSDTVRAATVPPGAPVHQVSTAGPFLRAVRGKGYFKGTGKAIAIDDIAVPLPWYGKLQAGQKSLLQFGAGQERFYLFPHSRILLRRDRKGHHHIRLLGGTLRVRSTGPLTTPVFIHMADGVRIGVPAGSDLLLTAGVQQGAARVQVDCLRGTGRLRIPMDGSAPPPEKNSEKGLLEQLVEEKKLIMPGEKDIVINLVAGTAVDFRTGIKAPPLIRSPDPGRLFHYIKASTPRFYDPPWWTRKDRGILEMDAEDHFRGAPLYILGKKGKGGPGAAKAVADRDCLKALELLFPAFESAGKKGGLALIIARCLGHLGDLQGAHSWFKKAAALKPESPGPPLYAAMMAARAGSAFQQRRWLEELDEHDGEDVGQFYHYHSGVLAFREGDDRTARVHFTRAVWLDKDAALTESSRDFLTALHNRETYKGYFRGGYFTDNNVFRTSPHAPPEDYPVGAGDGYQFGFALIRTDGPGGIVRTEWEITAKAASYKDSALQEVNPLDVRLESRIHLHTGAGGESDPFRALIRPFIVHKGLGSVTAADGFGLELTGTLPQVMLSPSLGLISAQHLSGTDAEELPVDPVTDQPFAGGERSSRDLTFRIGLQLLGLAPNGLSGKLHRRSHWYRNRLSRMDDFDETGITLIYRSRGMRLHWQAGLQNLQRDWPEHSSGRTDSATILTGKVAWYYLPMVPFEFGLEMTNQSSSDESAGWSRLLMDGGMAWEF